MTTVTLERTGWKPWMGAVTCRDCHNWQPSQDHSYHVCSLGYTMTLNWIKQWRKCRPCPSQDVAFAQDCLDFARRVYANSG